MRSDVETITIESDERGFELHLTTGLGATYTFNVHSCAEALHEQVNLIIGGWLAEGQAAARMPGSGRLTDAGYERPGFYSRPSSAFLCNPDESGGYATDDPKHPEFHSVHADLYDNREKV